MKANILFVGLNPNTNVQEKTPEICTFHGWCFKNKEHQKYLNVETGLLFSRTLIKFLATRLVPLLVFTKRSNLTYVVMLVAVYLIYRNLPQLLSILCLFKLAELMCFHIKCSAKC